MSAYLVVRDGCLSVVGKLHQRAQVGAQVWLASNQQHFSVGTEFLNFPFPLWRKTKTSITNAFINVAFDMTGSHTISPPPPSPASAKVTATTSWSPFCLSDLQIIPCFPLDDNEWAVISGSSLGSFLSECKALRGWLTWGAQVHRHPKRKLYFVYCVNHFPSALAHLIKSLDQRRRSSSETWSLSPDAHTAACEQLTDCEKQTCTTFRQAPPEGKAKYPNKSALGDCLSYKNPYIFAWASDFLLSQRLFLKLCPVSAWPQSPTATCDEMSQPVWPKKPPCSVTSFCGLLI